MKVRQNKLQVVVQIEEFLIPASASNGPPSAQAKGKADILGMGTIEWQAIESVDPSPDKWYFFKSNWPKGLNPKDREFVLGHISQALKSHKTEKNNNKGLP